MLLSRRLPALCLRFAALLRSWPLSAQAQGQYPSQAIKLIVPYAAGGLPDTTARIVGARLQEKIGQSVVVENRARRRGQRRGHGASMPRPPTATR